jgi:hypothetical protein
LITESLPAASSTRSAGRAAGARTRSTKLGTATWAGTGSLHPVDALHLENNALGEGIGHDARYRHDGLRSGDQAATRPTTATGQSYTRTGDAVTGDPARPEPRTPSAENGTPRRAGRGPVGATSDLHSRAHISRAAAADRVVITECGGTTRVSRRSSSAGLAAGHQTPMWPPKSLLVTATRCNRRSAVSRHPGPSGGCGPGSDERLH